MGGKYILITAIVIILVLFIVIYFEYRRLRKTVFVQQTHISNLSGKVAMIHNDIINLGNNKIVPPKEITVLSTSYHTDKNKKNEIHRIKTESLFDSCKNTSESINSNSSNTVILNAESSIKSIGEYNILLNNINEDVKKIDEKTSSLKDKHKNTKKI